MDSKSQKIYIVGAGVSGLIAALTLEGNGFSPIILESTDRAGGRVKTDVVDGFQLDHGFQVLLSSYEAAQKYLNYDSLNLQEFKSGSCIFIDGVFCETFRVLASVISGIAEHIESGLATIAKK